MREYSICMEYSICGNRSELEKNIAGSAGKIRRME